MPSTPNNENHHHTPAQPDLTAVPANGEQPSQSPAIYGMTLTELVQPITNLGGPKLTFKDIIGIPTKREQDLPLPQ